ncbi:MAG: PFL family protein, partial [Clostridia bacterium]|nr:PFL family protein [Clostridia bacterium]
TPISLIAAASKTDDYTCFAHALQKAADLCGVNFIGGFSALVHKGFTESDLKLIRSLPRALTETSNVCASVNVASTKAGINMDAVQMMGKTIKELAYLTKDQNSLGCAKLVVFANVPEDNPFMAGAFHGVGEGECVINVGVSGPGVVKTALEKCNGDLTAVAETIKKTAFKITRMGQLVASEASRRLNVPFGIVDLSLAPTPAIGDSVAHILEEMGLEQCGAHGTTACLALLNDAVKKGGVMASSHVGGLSGAFIPVSEDAGMIAAAEQGVLTLDKLEAMTAVCSVGLDMIAVPGDTSEDIISAIIADEIAIGVVNTKTTAVRIIPAYGKNVGEYVEFGGLLGTAPIMPVRNVSPAKFIARGGRIPAPMQSLKN